MKWARSVDIGLDVGVSARFQWRIARSGYIDVSAPCCRETADAVLGVGAIDAREGKKYPQVQFVKWNLGTEPPLEPACRATDPSEVLDAILKKMTGDKEWAK